MRRFNCPARFFFNQKLQDFPFGSKPVFALITGLPAAMLVYFISAHSDHRLNLRIAQ
jgi:hypothetical protein